MSTTTFNGGKSDDVFNATSSNDIFNGGQGTDTVVYDGRYQDYLIDTKFQTGNLSTTVAGKTVAAITGSDQLHFIETIKFSDGSYDIATGVFTPSMPTISILDAQAVEGGKSIQFTVHLSSIVSAGDGDVIGQVQLQFGTGTGSADIGDFAVKNVGGSGPTFLFAIPEGSDTARIIVPLRDDALVEGNETFSLNIVNVDGALIGDGNAVGTIIDNDFQHVNVFGPNIAKEGDTFQFSLTRDGAAETPLTVSYNVGTEQHTATFGVGENKVTVDYTAPDDHVAGTAPLPISLRVNDGQNYDLGTNPTQNVAVLDNDPYLVSVFAPISASEGDNYTLRFERDGVATSPLQFSFTFNGEAHTGLFNAGDQHVDLMFAAPDDDLVGVTPGPIQVALTDNSSAYNVGAAGTATINVVDDDTSLPPPPPPGGGGALPVVGIFGSTTGDNTISEGTDGLFTFTRTGDVSAPLTIEFAVNSTTFGSAVLGQDFAITLANDDPISFHNIPATHPDGTPAEIQVGTITFAAGQTMANVEVHALNDSPSEPLETFSLGVSPGTGYQNDFAHVGISVGISDPTFFF